MLILIILRGGCTEVVTKRNLYLLYLLFVISLEMVKWNTIVAYLHSLVYWHEYLSGTLNVNSTAEGDEES